jgi:endonuclease/exonuclease/phosphatase family metal-dependent hydrolase
MGAVSHRFVAALSGTPGATWMAATGSELPDTAAYGISLLSRYPASSWQVLRLPRIPVRFPMWLPGPRKVIVVDEEPRSVIIGQLETPIGPLVVANAHLSFVPGWGRRQLVRMRRDLAAFGEPVILMGDLNMPAPRPERITGYRSLAQHNTFPVERPDRQLDHVLLRGRIGEVIGSSAPALPLSDHRALVVELTDPS